MSRRHKVKTHHWIDGMLQSMEHYFDSAAEANMFASSVNAHTAKVYDADENLISTIQTSVNTNTTATPVSDTSYA
jgi:hypothetical protein